MGELPEEECQSRNQKACSKTEPQGGQGEGPKCQVLPPSLSTLVEANAVRSKGRIEWGPSDGLVEVHPSIMVSLGAVHLTLGHESMEAEPVMSNGRSYTAGGAADLRNKVGRGRRRDPGV